MDWFAFNEVPWFFRDGESRDLGDNYWGTRAVGVNVSDILAKLEYGDGGGRQFLVMLRIFGHERDSSREEWSLVQFLCETETRGRGSGAGTTFIWRGGRVIFGR